jgi:hypothetical protein
MRPVLAVVAGRDYEHLELRCEALLYRLVTSGGRYATPLVQAAIVLPKSARQSLIQDITIKFDIDSDAVAMTREESLTGTVLFFPRATDESLNRMQQYLSDHRLINKVERYSLVREAFNEVHGIRLSST